MSSMYLINSVVASLGSGTQTVRSGELITDSGVQASLQAAGGVLASASDPVVAAAAAIVSTLRANKGQSEDLCDKIMLAAFSSSATGLAVQRLTIDIPLATIQAQTSGAAFNVGAVLPANARVVDSEINVLATITGGTIASAHATLQGGTDAAGSLIASSDVFTATGTFSPIGSNPYPTRGGQQLKMTLTTTGDTLAHATTGHLSVDIFYHTVA